MLLILLKQPSPVAEIESSELFTTLPTNHNQHARPAPQHAGDPHLTLPTPSSHSEVHTSHANLLPSSVNTLPNPVTVKSTALQGASKEKEESKQEKEARRLARFLSLIYIFFIFDSLSFLLRLISGVITNHLPLCLFFFFRHLFRIFFCHIFPAFVNYSFDMFI